MEVFVARFRVRFNCMISDVKQSVIESVIDSVNREIDAHASALFEHLVSVIKSQATNIANGILPKNSTISNQINFVQQHSQADVSNSSSTNRISQQQRTETSRLSSIPPHSSSSNFSQGESQNGQQQRNIYNPSLRTTSDFGTNSNSDRNLEQLLTSAAKSPSQTIVCKPEIHDDLIEMPIDKFNDDNSLDNHFQT